MSFLNVYWRQKSTNAFGFDWNLQHNMCWCQHKYVPKIIKFRGGLPQKTTRGDNWPPAITGRLPVVCDWWRCSLRNKYDTLSTLPHCHMILSKQKCCLLLTGFSTRSQKRTSVLQTKYYLYKCWTCAELCEAFTFLMENIYVTFEGMVYQQSGDSYVNKLCCIRSGLVFIFLWEGFDVSPSQI